MKKPKEARDSEDTGVLRVCEAFLHHRRLVVALFLIATIVGICCIPQVKVDYNIMDYLPAESPSTQTLDLMEDTYNSGIPNARLYAEGIDLATANRLSQTLANLPDIEQVMWLGTAVDTRVPLKTQDQETVKAWKSDNGYLFQLTVNDGDAVEGVSSARQAALDAGATRVSMEGHIVSMADIQSAANREIPFILLLAIVIVAVILTLTATSWFEPVIFLVTIGAAICINMGSNLVMGTISFVSQICGAVMQLAVSMDYAIVLLHTYRRCQRLYDDPIVAMAHAMRKGFPVVLSSAAVTFFGFLSLVFMRFGIGPDMGIVFSKGIVFSFLSVMFLMPCLILMWSKPMERLEHRPFIPPLTRFANVCQKIMVPAAIIICLIAVPCYIAEGRTDFVYGSASLIAPGSELDHEQIHIDDDFGPEETWALMVPEGHWADEQALIDDIRAMDHVAGVTSYITVAGRAMPVQIAPADQVDQVIQKGWSRIVITTDTGTEGDACFSLVEKVRSAAQQYYGDDYGLTGIGVCVYDMRNTVIEDASRVQLFSAGMIGIVLAVMFRSLSIPFIALFAIKVSIWINLSVPYFTGDTLHYIAYMVLDAVQLGSAVDYAIIYTREYFDRRATYAPREAARSAVKHAGLPIITSSTILLLAGFIVGFISSNQIISQLGFLIGRGAFIAMLMMFLLLPCLLRVFDWVIRHTTLGLDFGGAAQSDLNATPALADAAQTGTAETKGARDAKRKRASGSLGGKGRMQAGGDAHARSSGRGA